MSLDNFGRVGIATAIFYLPIFVISVILVIRHGFKRDAGWIFLAIFSLIRIIGGSLLVAAQLTRPVQIGLFIGAYVAEAAGLSPLLLATLGFLRTIGKNSLSENPVMTKVFRLLGLLGTVALALSVYGGTSAGDSDPSKASQGTTLRRVGVGLFAALYVLLALLHLYFWSKVSTLMKHRRTLLIAISCALPFLGIRLLYSILSTFSGSMIQSTTGTPNTSSLAKFNMATGEWYLYLIMALVPEYSVVLIYIIFGARLPLQQDYQPNSNGYGAMDPSEETLPLGEHKHQGNGNFQQPGGYAQQPYVAPQGPPPQHYSSPYAPTAYATQGNYA